MAFVYVVPLDSLILHELDLGPLLFLLPVVDPMELSEELERLKIILTLD